MTRLLKHIIHLLGFVFIPILSLAQQTEADKLIESIIESQADKLDEETDAALIIEDLEYLAENPININNTNADELSRLYILDNIQINKLLDYIENYGPAYSIFELNAIDGLTRDLLTKIQAFVWFGPETEVAKTLKEELQYGNHQLLARGLGNLQKAAGYQTKDDDTRPYEGNRFRYYTRYNFIVKNKLSAGITAEKDPGEAFFKGTNKHGFDFYSGHLSLRLNSFVENISVGDFVIRSGQGLVLWQGYSSGKSENVLGISKTGQGARAYTSVDENNYFRGATTTFNFGEGKLNLFFSQKKVDGNLAGSDTTEIYFTSLQTSGYHRTQSEIDDEKSVKDLNIGSVISWNFKNLNIGSTFVYQKFDIPFIRSSELYNLYRFGGSENYTAGIDYLFSKGRYRLFGEAALSKSKGKAIIQGLVAHLNDQLSFSALFRHFDKDYHALWANPFAEGSSISNESGLYLGAKFLPAKHLTLSAYSDIYRSKWIAYSTAGPADAWDIFIQADFYLSEKFNFYFRLKNEEKEQKSKDEALYVNLTERTQKARFQIQYKPLETFKLKTRIEHAYYKGESTENGYMVFQDFQFIPENLPLSLTVRLAWFDTQSYDARIYAYENDILYTFSVPAYYGKGLRTYLNMKYKISKKIECWAKLANTHWTDRDVISSGYNEIAGNNKTELKFQLRLKF